MMGATGAVGTECVKQLVASGQTEKLTLLGRRKFEEVQSSIIEQQMIDIHQPDTYKSVLHGHDVAICTLGIGQPSKVSKEVFIKVDKLAVLNFAKACKGNGVKHFQLLASVGIDANSRSFYLRAKGELVEELKALQFDRLSIFQPSMILTPTNRYGFSQAVTLAVWPVLDKVFFGTLKKYKGVKVSNLGASIANNSFTQGSGIEYLTWQDFDRQD